ncbi:helix-turn-helix domain-containing protein [Pseudomonas monteilii]|uniref:helix-turn-helix domain-containing protein n=1 Tax=Pseudomonas monteilii TaxID=76759 RepID=UPI001CBD9CC5|nr:helix-turn-helix transcriptional regulator [Pseudomonas monteilii]MBZ3664899.1 helix-turn-helix transcriptional regulator [Pseudomonas monteilii]MBZ3670244.1 helix-turn-helix transcriptional regulator [Pseudomonas monteilii]
MQSCAIGERLREERERFGWNQEELGQLGGVNRNTQGKYEKGDRSPDAAYLAALAEKGVDVLYVLTGERKSQAPGDISAEETQLVTRYRRMSAEARVTIDSVSEALASFNK